MPTPGCYVRVLQFSGVRSCGFDSDPDASALEHQAREQVAELYYRSSICCLAVRARIRQKTTASTDPLRPNANALVRMG